MEEMDRILSPSQRALKKSAERRKKCSVWGMFFWPIFALIQVVNLVGGPRDNLGAFGSTLFHVTAGLLILGAGVLFIRNSRKFQRCKQELAEF